MNRSGIKLSGSGKWSESRDIALENSQDKNGNLSRRTNVVHSPEVSDDDSALWDEISLEFIIVSSRVGNTYRNHGMPPHKLLDDSFYVRQRVKIRTVW